jgi:hypothetical protein
MRLQHGSTHGLYSSPALTSRERVIRVVGFLFAALAAVQVVRLTVFSVDPSRTGAAVYPFDQFYVQHSCLSAYFQAAKLGQARVPNLYDETLYVGTLGRFNIGTGTCIHRSFCLLPRALLGITVDFYRFRVLWFVFEIVAFLTALLIVARWIGGRHGRTVLMLTGLLLAAVPTGMTLQIGNFQIVAFALAMLALVLIESDFVVSGTALLAFVAASKLFPGILVVWLAFQRRWRAIAWVLAWNVVLLLAAVLWFGWAPISAFFQYEMPRLSFPLHGPINIEITPFGGKTSALNYGITAVVPKLRALGWTSLGFGAFQMVRLLYLLLLIGLFVRLRDAFSARWVDDAASFRLHEAQTWLALLNLASFLSPFVPDGYAVIGTLWLLILVVPEIRFTWSKVTALVLVWLALNVVAPLGPGLPEVGLVTRIVAGFLVQSILIFVNVRVLLTANARGSQHRRGWLLPDATQGHIPVAAASGVDSAELPVVSEGEACAWIGGGNEILVRKSGDHLPNPVIFQDHKVAVFVRKAGLAVLAARIPGR